MNGDQRIASPPSPALSRRLLTFPFVFLIWIYRLTLSPILGGQCRYHPTCSQYALDAYLERGVIAGTRLTLARLARCHPFATGGYDPVPHSREDRVNEDHVNTAENRVSQTSPIK